MRSILSAFFKDASLSISVIFLIIFSVAILTSLDGSPFPLYFIYIIFAIGAFWFFSQVNFDITSLFSKHFYIASIILLITTLIIGRVTRGTFRWIPIGPFSLQPAELVRPLLLVFFADYMTKGTLDIKKAFKSVGLLAIPVILILIQPSLGVSILTMVGFAGVLIASKFDKKYLLAVLAGIVILLPVFWSVLAPYQKQRISTFLTPAEDPLGAGYNSLQSTIAVGSGKLF